MGFQQTFDPSTQKARSVLGGSSVLSGDHPSHQPARKPYAAISRAASAIPPDSIGKSNLDLTGYRIVKRGAIISWGGLRMKVSRVRMGKFIAEGACGRWMSCSLVQVVA